MYVVACETTTRLFRRPPRRPSFHEDVSFFKDFFAGGPSFLFVPFRLLNFFVLYRLCMIYFFIAQGAFLCLTGFFVGLPYMLVLFWTLAQVDALQASMHTFCCC